MMRSKKIVIAMVTLALVAAFVSLGKNAVNRCIDNMTDSLFGNTLEDEVADRYGDLFGQACTDDTTELTLAVTRDAARDMMATIALNGLKVPAEEALETETVYVAMAEVASAPKKEADTVLENKEETVPAPVEAVPAIPYEEGTQDPVQVPECMEYAMECTGMGTITDVTDSISAFLAGL